MDEKINGLELTPDLFEEVKNPTEDMASSYERKLSAHIWKMMRENKLFLLCVVMLVVIVLASLAAPLSPYDPDAINVAEKLQGISTRHWLGTDDLGRDLFTRTLYGGRVTLLVAVSAMLAAVIFGTFIGTLSGYKGGIVDMLCMRAADIFMSIPGLLITMIFYAFISPSLPVLVFMLALFTWTQTARVVRAQTLTLKERDFVLAARSLGTSDFFIVIRHIIPNLTSQIIVAASLSIANAILNESVLSFLGYGVQLPMASWGSMLQTAQKYILYNPLLAIGPGVMIFLTVLSFNVIGDGLQHILDPKLTK